MTQTKKPYKRGAKTVLNISSGHQAKPTQSGTDPAQPADDLLSSVPRAPATLGTKERKAVWRATCRVLHQRGLLNGADLDLVEAYSWSASTYREYRKLLDRAGHIIRDSKGNLVENPARKVVRDELNIMMRLGRELGLSPRARLELAALMEKVKNLRRANAEDVVAPAYDDYIGRF